MKRTKINLLFVLVLAITVSCALWETRASADNGSPTSYHNGPLHSISAATVAISVSTNPASDGFDPNANALVRTTVVQPDGKILIGGDFTTLAPNGGPAVTRNYIARLNPDGTVDPTFDPNANSSIQAIALQPDGKIILAGDFNRLAPNGGALINRGSLARFNADGTIDMTFDPPAANGSIHAVVVQADGGIVVGGEFETFALDSGAIIARNHIARVNPNGTIDQTFDPKANSTVDTVAVQSDGRLLMGGRFTALAPNGGATVTRNYVARLNIDGTLDAPFNPNPDNILGSIALQADGKILIGGSFVTLTPNGGANIARNHLVRLNPDGAVDTAFNPAPNSFVRTIVLQPDDRILIGGSFTSLAPNGGASVFHKYIARLNPDGTLMPGLDPAPNDQVFAIAVQPDGKIVVGGVFLSANSFGGQTRNRIARLETDGRVDQTLLDLNAVGGTVYCTAVQSDGKILIGGQFTSVLGVARKNIARLNSDGTLDTTFNPGANSNVSAIAVEPDARILIGGDFAGPNSVGGQSRNFIARLNSDGSVDSTFDPNADDDVATILLQPDGKILLGGTFTALAPNGGTTVRCSELARLNPNGSVEMSFNPVPNSEVYSIALQPDGRILVGGNFTALAPNGGMSVPRNYIARLNVDGTPDMTFDPNANSDITAIAVRPDGKVLLGGDFTQLAPGGAAVARNRLAQLNADGTVDPAFNPNANGNVETIVLQPDGRMFVGGSFTALAPNGGASAQRNRIARLNLDGTADPNFDPSASNRVYTITLQADGKILVGGAFDAIGGQSRNAFARLTNDTAAIQILAVTPDDVLWTRSGAAPQLSSVTFERSTDGINYTPLGAGTRVGTSSDFSLGGQNLPTQQSLYVRARGTYRGGNQTGSESITESMRNVFIPPALHLAFSQQPTNTAESVIFAPPVAVQILDASNNLVNSTAAVTIGVGTNPSSGTLTGTTTVAAVAGTATFNNLSIDKIGNGYTLTTAGTNFTGAVSNPFNITAAAPSSISAAAGSGQSATINSIFATPLQTKVTDTFANPVSGVMVTFTAPANGASGTFTNHTTTTTASTDMNGVAVASSFTANGTAGLYSISASINAGTVATTFNLTNTKANQTISVTSHGPAGAAYNSQFNVAAVSSSGLPVSYSSSGSCTNNVTAFTMTARAGNCTVKYDQGGDNNYNAAPQMTDTVAGQKATQTITFNPLANKTFGDPDFTLNAATDSSLNVIFAAAGNCGVAGGTVHVRGAGSCTITASQPGNSLYEAAQDVARSFSISKASQTINFDALPDKTFGDADFVVSASASAGPGVSFSAAGQCSNSASSVHLSGAGVCLITASQSGDSNYNAAADVTRSFQISKAATTTELSYSTAGQSATLTAAVSSLAGNPSGAVTFRENGNPVALCGDVTLSAGHASCVTSAMPAGSHTITAEYSGEANFNGSIGTLTTEGLTGSVFEFSQSTYVVAEQDGSVTITVNRTGDATTASSVDYATDDGSVPSVAVPCAAVTGIALERCDYTRAAGTLHFAANQTEQTFVVLVNDDSYVEGTETVALTLSNPGSGASLGARATATLQILDDAVEPAGNPNDDPATFVRQHYHDLLNREPDADGLKFWTGNITSCDTNNCADAKRVDTSAAFFLSIEFQETGYLVERLYKVAYGDAAGTSTFGGPHQLAVPIIRLRDFLRDTQEIGQGIVVGQNAWQQQLEDHKQAFALEFISRQRFRDAYPATLSAAEFVNQLNLDAGGVLTDAEMADLKAVFGGPNQSSADVAERAQVLRSIAENQTLRQKEFNRAFVLMQYYGYLRRNPDDAQDTDYSGYDFWLGKLDHFGGNYIDAEMVKAFISSTEYRQRFGQ
jgi:uncharacterized delta-60 repeat protein